MITSPALRRAKFEVESRLGTREIPYRWLMSTRPRTRPLLARRNTDVVIEGFPRSGNTFAVVAFEHAQPRRLRIARHLHAPAQVRFAARHAIPAIVLIRDPGDAVLSLLIREPYLTADRALGQYVRFYRSLLGHRGRFVVGDFPEVVTDFGAVMRRLNDLYGSDFTPFEHTDENVEACFQRIEHMDMADTGRATVGETTVARPSPARRREKEALQEELEAPHVRDRLERARDLHAEFVS